MKVYINGEGHMTKMATPGGLSAKFIGIYFRSQLSVHRTIGPLVICSINTQYM